MASTNKLKKPSQILLAGHSFLAGFFMKQLEQNLQKTLPTPVEVINLCVSGYDTVQEVEFLSEKGLALGPDQNGGPSRPGEIRVEAP